MDQTVLNALKKLNQSGGKVIFTVSTPFGGQDAIATPEHAAGIISGEISPAALVGLSSAEHAEWVALGGFVQCHGNTIRGARCRSVVTNSCRTVALEWKVLDATKPYCHVHGGA